MFALLCLNALTIGREIVKASTLEGEDHYYTLLCHPYRCKGRGEETFVERLISKFPIMQKQEAREDRLEIDER